MLTCFRQCLRTRLIACWFPTSTAKISAREFLRKTDTDSFLVIKDGQILTEQYFAAHNQTALNTCSLPASRWPVR